MSKAIDYFSYDNPLLKVKTFFPVGQEGRCIKDLKNLCIRHKTMRF